MRDNPVDRPCDHWMVLEAASQVVLLKERNSLNAFLRPLASVPKAEETVVQARLQ